jgi:hypothetical protein
MRRTETDPLYLERKRAYLRRWTERTSCEDRLYSIRSSDRGLRLSDREYVLSSGISLLVMRSDDLSVPVKELRSLKIPCLLVLITADPKIKTPENPDTLGRYWSRLLYVSPEQNAAYDVRHTIWHEDDRIHSCSTDGWRDLDGVDSTLDKTLWQERQEHLTEREHYSRRERLDRPLCSCELDHHYMI